MKLYFYRSLGKIDIQTIKEVTEALTLQLVEEAPLKRCEKAAQ